MGRSNQAPTDDNRAWAIGLWIAMTLAMVAFVFGYFVGESRGTLRTIEHFSMCDCNSLTDGG
jgi:hypothetical protein